MSKPIDIVSEQTTKALRLINPSTVVNISPVYVRHKQLESIVVKVMAMSPVGLGFQLFGPDTNHPIFAGKSFIVIQHSHGSFNTKCHMRQFKVDNIYEIVPEVVEFFSPRISIPYADNELNQLCFELLAVVTADLEDDEGAGIFDQTTGDYYLPIRKELYDKFQ